MIETKIKKRTYKQGTNNTIKHIKKKRKNRQITTKHKKQKKNPRIKLKLKLAKSQKSTTN